MAILLIIIKLVLGFNIMFAMLVAMGEIRCERKRHRTMRALELRADGE